MCVLYLPSTSLPFPLVLTELVHRPKQQRKHGCMEVWSLPEGCSSAPTCSRTGMFLLKLCTSEAESEGIKSRRCFWDPAVTEQWAAGRYKAESAFLLFFFLSKISCIRYDPSCKEGLLLSVNTPTYILHRVCLSRMNPQARAHRHTHL